MNPPVDPRRRLPRVLVLVLAVAFLFLFTHEAFARGGGGGGFGGGGGGGHGGGGFSGGSHGGGFSSHGSSSSRGGGGGGGGGPARPLTWIDGLLALLFFGFFACFFCAFIYTMGKGIIFGVRSIRASGTEGPGGILVPSNTGGKALRAIGVLRAVDPRFDEKDFGAYARRAFAAVQDGWCSQDPGILRPFVSDGVFERFSLQIEEQREAGFRDRMEGLRILEVSPIEAASAGPVDVVVACFRFVASDFRVSLEDGRLLDGSRKPSAASEFWTFLRVRADGREDVAPAACSGCGAALPSDRVSLCASCGTAVRRRSHGWVLAEITQPEVWRSGAGSSAPGFGGLRSVDPGFHLASLEDRASVLFWRQARAERLGTAAPLLPFATKEWAERAGAALEADAARGSRSWWGDRSVGSVDTELILTRGDRHRALVKVVWRGTRFEKHGSGPGTAGARGES